MKKSVIKIFFIIYTFLIKKNFTVINVLALQHLINVIILLNTVCKKFLKNQWPPCIKGIFLVWKFSRYNLLLHKKSLFKLFTNIYFTVSS